MRGISGSVPPWQSLSGRWTTLCEGGIEVDEVGEEMDCLTGGAGGGEGAGAGGDELLPQPVIISHCTHAFFNQVHTQSMRNS